MRDVTIHAVLNGFTVQVGCQTLVFQTAEEMLRELKNYLDAPETTEKRFLEASRFGKIGVPTAGPSAGGYGSANTERCATAPPGDLRHGKLWNPPTHRS